MEKATAFRLRTTDMCERLNEEIRRRERVIRIFPNEASAERMVGALLAEQHERWVSERRYFERDTYWQWKQRLETATAPMNFTRSAA